MSWGSQETAEGITERLTNAFAQYDKVASPHAPHRSSALSALRSASPLAFPQSPSALGARVIFGPQPQQQQQLMQLDKLARGEDQIKCQLCPRAFATKKEAKKHFLRRHSAGEGSFSCLRCAKPFNVHEDHTMHVKTCGQVFVCRCGLRLHSQAALKRHCSQAAHEPTSWEGVQVPLSAAEIASGSERLSRASIDTDGSDLDSSRTGTLTSTPASSPYASPVARRNRQFSRERRTSSEFSPAFAVVATAAAALSNHMAAEVSSVAGASSSVGAHEGRGRQEADGGQSTPVLEGSDESTLLEQAEAIEDMTMDELLEVISSGLALG